MPSQEELLLTKLHIPGLRSDLVARPRLLARLDEGRPRKLTLLSAPAGSGKTTLLCQWIDGNPLPAAWLTLDAADNDLARFLTYLAAALRRISSDIGSDMLANLRATKPPRDEELLTSLANDMTRCDKGLLLVLDDYNVIEQARVHEAMAFLVDAMPATVQTIIASRTDPPFQLARMRGRGELLELRLQDVRFTPQESQEFIRRMAGIELTAKQVDALHARTEGWVAGLQMAALTLHGHSDPAAFIQSFSGDDRYIMDYLLEEVLSRQDKLTRSFMLRSSILERFTSSLCDAVAYQDAEAGKSRKMIAQLERSNLFLVSLDPRREWFRFHQLFRDLLRQRLQSLEGDLIPDLHSRASSWFWERSHKGKDHAFVTAAIEHSLSAGDMQAAADLIVAAAETVFMRSEVATFLGWIQRVPEEMLARNPLACLYVALALTIRGERLQEIQEWIDRSRVADAEGYQGERAAVEGLLLNMQGDAAQSIQVSQQALEKLPEDRLFLRSLVADSLGLSYLLRGDIDAAIEALEEAARIGERIGSVITTAGAMTNVAGLVMNAGQLKRAERLYRRALELSIDERGRLLPVGGKALLGLGELAREWNQLEEAEAYIRQAIEAMKVYGDLGDVVGYLSLSRLAQYRRDPGTAQEYVERSLQLARETETIEMDDRLSMLQQVRIWVGERNLAAAEQWMRDLGLQTRPLAGTDEYRESARREYFYIDMAERLTQIRVLRATGERARALEITQAYLAQMEQMGQMKRVIEFLLLKALILADLDRMQEAMETLDRALATAEPEGYLRIFLDEGEPMAALLYKAVEANIRPRYAARLLAAFEGQRGEDQASPGSRRAEHLVEALSEREIEVLSLIAQGLSNQQIAQKLVLSLATVKWHAGNIYGKLGARNRSQAVAIARSFGIL